MLNGRCPAGSRVLAALGCSALQGLHAPLHSYPDGLQAGYGPRPTEKAHQHDEGCCRCLYPITRLAWDPLCSVLSKELTLWAAQECLERQ